MKALTIPSSKNAKWRLAQPRRFFQHRIEYRGEIAGRGVDDTEHLGGRGLLLQSLALLCQQSHILDCDDSLIGKRRDQLDLLVAERLDPLAPQHDHPDRRPFAQERYTELSAQVPECCCF